ncbi:unannotated protein [freshwater metagenome]|uniref:Unannotated protein n=1 Tax=freshwater metagenome TaxID=449393 RepID=A0A6J7AIE7_9ZZZZ
MSSATTTATGSPTNRTVPRASKGRLNASGHMPGPNGGGMSGRPRSSKVSTANTPGMASASAVSIDVMWAWAMVDRTNTATAAPASTTSPT